MSQAIFGTKIGVSCSAPFFCHTGSSNALKLHSYSLLLKGLLCCFSHVGDGRISLPAESYNSLENYFYRQQTAVMGTDQSNSSSSASLRRKKPSLLSPSALFSPNSSPHLADAANGRTQRLQQRKLSEVRVPVSAAPELRALDGLDAASDGVGAPVHTRVVKKSSSRFINWIERKRSRRRFSRKRQPAADPRDSLSLTPEALELLKVLPADTESALVMVGAVEFLTTPVLAFLRLDKPLHLRGATELPLPARFLFLLLGPLNAGLDYHEVGRAMATLLSNKEFGARAYKAASLPHLLSAISDFLDDAIVLPPWKWEDGGGLLPTEQIKVLQNHHQHQTSDGHRNGDNRIFPSVPFGFGPERNGKEI